MSSKHSRQRGGPGRRAAGGVPVPRVGEAARRRREPPGVVGKRGGRAARAVPQFWLGAGWEVCDGCEPHRGVVRFRRSG